MSDIAWNPSLDSNTQKSRWNHGRSRKTLFSDFPLASSIRPPTKLSYRSGPTFDSQTHRQQLQQCYRYRSRRRGRPGLTLYVASRLIQYLNAETLRLLEIFSFACLASFIVRATHHDNPPRTLFRYPPIRIHHRNGHPSSVAASSASQGSTRSER